MITFKRCSEVDMSLTYEAFTIGFSDYIIKIEMPMDAFVNRFFGVEGNCPETSFVALDGEKAVGLILGGVKEYEGIKTMRCGSLAVHPDYRGKGISGTLFLMHKLEALKQGCRQMFLEVIVGNDRALGFYKKCGYEKVYDLHYYSLKDINLIKEKPLNSIEIRECSYLMLQSLADSLDSVHINWQNDLDYIRRSEGQITLGAYDGSKLIGIASVNRNSRISYLWVNRVYRNRGIAANLLILAAKQLNIDKLSIGSPNNASIEGFLRHAGFKKDNISQYEMYLTL